jgi:hypothetical protein
MRLCYGLNAFSELHTLEMHPREKRLTALVSGQQGIPRQRML